MLVHSYARFSDPKQAGGDSLRRQREQAEAFCKRRGWTLSDLRFEDLGRSGFRGNKQKALDAFLKAIADGRVRPGEVLLVEAVDRLSRKGVRATQTIVNKILEAGIDIAILAPVEKVYRAADGNDIGGAIELAAFAFQAATYSQNLSHRIKAHSDQSRKRLRAGDRVIVSGILPGWIRRNGERLELIPEQAATVRLIFKRTIEGVGRKQLLAELSRDAHKPMGTRRKTGGRWNETMLGGIVKGRAVLGELRTVAGEVFPDYYPPVIDETIWAKAQAATESRRPIRGPQKSDWMNLFGGILFHAGDGATMRVSSSVAKGRSFRRYVSARAVSEIEGADRSGIDSERFESLIFKFLPTIRLEQKTDSPEDDLAAEERRLAAEVRELQERITGGEGAAVLAGPLVALGQQLEAVRERIRKTAGPQQKPTQAYRKRLSDLRRGTRDERLQVRQGLLAIIDRIECLPIKTGPQRRDSVRALVEIRFRNGSWVRGLELPDGRIVEIRGAGDSQSLSGQLATGWKFGVAEYEKAVNAVRE